jgi:hypothetical protein
MIKRNLLTLLAAGTLALSGCESEKSQIIPEETLTGIPINAEAAIAYHTDRLSVMIKKQDGSYVLCNATEYKKGFYWWHGNIQEAKTIIQSEIDDNDNEPISLKGIYKGDRFEFSSVSANGYTISAKRK